MAADDREILREVWEGRIPICFSLSEDEVFADQPEPLYLMVSRVTYLTLISERIEKHFRRSLQREEDDEIWFDFNHQPLRWHYPVGVLFDLYAHGTPLPWNVKVHFKNFPEGEVLHCKTKEVIEAHFMSSVKEADVLKHRGKVVVDMQRRDHKQLWNGLQNDKFDQFWTINRKLMERVNEEPFKLIPFRIYQANRLFIQRSFRPVADTGEPLTLYHLLNQFVPECISPESDYKVLLHGIEAPQETPVQWLSEHVSYPDNFLHLCIVQRSPNP